MGDLLSQNEIEALLSGNVIDEVDTSKLNSDFPQLSDIEKDVLGEFGNICIGTSATTLSTLLNQRVTVNTPVVSLDTWGELAKNYNAPLVAVRVEYLQGLVGNNILLLTEKDTKIITSLMMGQSGEEFEGELTELHLSAISEAMNQMIGSAATSMASFLNKKVDISPPKSISFSFENSNPFEVFNISKEDYFVKVSFKIVIGTLIDSEIMQLIPLNFAKSLVATIIGEQMPKEESTKPQYQPQAQQTQIQQAEVQQSAQNNMPSNQYSTQQTQQPMYNETPMSNNIHRQNVNIQPAQFQSFDENQVVYDKKNIGLIMEVPLQVTVELGRTVKPIKEILEFGAGTVIELDKLAGDAIDILVNGKIIAKGEVVVIDESFGIRITEIINPSKRL